jgi:hypothetical protein
MIRVGCHTMNDHQRSPPSSPSSPPLVWVKQGKEQQPAFLIEEGGEIHRIKWASTDLEEWVDAKHIERQLTPRRQRLTPVRKRSPSKVLHRSENPSASLKKNKISHSNRVTLSPNSASQKLSHKLASDKKHWVATNKEHAPSKAACNDNNDDDDNEVEILLTILPPSPKRRVHSLHQAFNDASSRQESPNSSDESSIDNVPIAALRDTKPESLIEESELKWVEQKRVEEPPQHKEETEPMSDPPVHSMPERFDDGSDQDGATIPLSPATGSSEFQSPIYSERSSAYIQSLAEICHAILWDCRWRVGPQQQRLFAWERGEDLSAVHALSRCFEPLPQPKRPICTCLLCRDSKPESRESLKDAAPVIGNLETTESPETNGLPPFPGISIDTANDRSLNLYARLFSRKGPWFRIDDIFKYYSPKEKPSDLHQSTEQTWPTASANLPNSPSKFFNPGSTWNRRAQSSSVTDKTVENLIDLQLVERHLDCLELLVEDLQRLHQMGLIRSFRDEKECGKTVGEAQKYGLLRMEERGAILSKLGGSNKHKASLNGKTAPKGHGGTANENRIWKQMCQQQSLFFLVQGQERGSILPVSKHVDDAVVWSFATSIVLKSSRVDFIPAALLRSATVTVKEAVFRLLTVQHSSSFKCNGGGISATCIRLREPPTHTLRRFCRLFLCATSGPGDMRGDGSNGWRSVAEHFYHPSLEQGGVRTRVVQRPGAHSWHHVSYPGRNYRFKLIPCHFLRAHQPLMISQDGGSDNSRTIFPQVQVFSSIESFHVWEQCVELRSVADYLIELNDLLHYNERRQARSNEENGNGNGESLMGTSPQASRTQTLDVSVDFLDLLTSEGRSQLVDALVITVTTDAPTTNRDRNLAQHPRLMIYRAIERDVATLLGTADTDRHGSEHCSPVCRLKGESEMVLGVIAVVSIYVLEYSNQVASEKGIALIASRPWLRHLFWEGCLAYLLWDIIPILEKRKYYGFAVKALEVLLLGGTLTDCDSPGGAPVVLPRIVTMQGDQDETALAQFYLSRRARGKAHERLIIDYIHLLRKDAKTKAAETNSRQGKERPVLQKKAPNVEDPTAIICEDLIARFAPTGQITFCATRVLARRLKKPLSETIGNLSCFEVEELGHRFENQSDIPNKSTFKPNDKRNYSDWTPITDQAVANQMALDENAVGRRCSFIGFENDDNPLSLATLNVEELSMEYYRTGRLPTTDDALKGGWMGWHDEGGTIRRLFRILCSAAVLGMDWGCFNDTLDETAKLEHATIHLTRYQTAPCDLHVGAELNMNGETKGLYLRRRPTINRFLERLSLLRSQDLCDLVYDNISARMEYCKSTHQDDTMLEVDMQQVRTLSLVAAGLGGKQLAAVFRCLFFDYRHYIGGLPDLSLVRAVYAPTAEDPNGSLVDLGDWIGEMFSSDSRESHQAQQVIGFLEDREAEFLGCSKVGDSGGRTSNRSTRTGRQPSKMAGLEGKLELPHRLQLHHNDRFIIPECMLVEVKSHNDRLDPRQEDWLNILDQHGNARVCKFVKKNQPRKASGGQKKTVRQEPQDDNDH